MTKPLSGLPHLTRSFGCILVLATAALSLALCANASADLNFCPLGSGAGQCKEAGGVAVNRETELLYVADRGNDRIDVFDTSGAFKDSFGEGQLDRPSRIAIDNTGGPGQGDVYVIDRSFRVLKFKANGEFVKAFSEKGKGKCQISDGEGLTTAAIAVGPGGVVHVVDTKLIGVAEFEGFATRLEKFDEEGVCLEEIPLFEGRPSVAGLAVDSHGDFYLTDIGTGAGIRKFDSSGVEYGAPYPLDPDLEPRALGVDDEDDLFVGQREDTFRIVAEYDEAGSVLRRFGYGAIVFRLLGIAPFSSPFGDVFASDEKEINEEGPRLRYFDFPPPGPIVAPSTVKANPVANTKATLNARVNPEGKATEYHFEYLTQEAFEDQGGFVGPATKKTPVKSIATTAKTEFRLNLLSEQVGCLNPAIEAAAGKCLEPETAYRFRVVATNAEGEDEDESSFETKPALEIPATYATEVGTDTATLHAEVNPLGIPTTGYFQYVDDATYQESGFAQATQIPNVSEGEGALDFGSSEAPVAKAALLFPLSPDTTYHYRVIVEDPLVGTVTGPERALTTFVPLAAGAGGPCANEVFRSGLAAFLTDCRGYEMVSPLDKNNGDALPLIELFTELPAALNQSSLTGNRLTYSTATAFGDAVSAPYSAQYIAARDPEAGWQSHAIVPPRQAPLLVPGKQTDVEYKFFSPDLCSGWLRTTAEPVLAPGANPRFANLYRRQDEECGGSSYEALTVLPPSHEGGEGARYPGNYYFSLELQGVSANGGKAIYTVLDSLTEDAAPQSQECLEDVESAFACGLQLYEYSAEDQSLHYVCVLPSGQASKACSAGTAVDNSAFHRENRLDNAISADGSRVFWTSMPNLGPGKIYLRENPTQPPSEVVGGECTEVALACTIAVSKEAEALSGANASQYWSAAEDGSKAIFTTGEDLYEFTVKDKATQLIAHEVSGVMGASEDASRIYFTSKEDLGGGATAGGQNLYLYEGGTFHFVATLASTDVFEGANGNDFSVVATEPRRQLSRVSADGLHVVFMSQASLTGYDNKDAVNGKAAAEVYLYDAAADEGQGKLVCPSCNPTGARPVGSNFAFKPEDEYWAAAQIQFPESSLYSARVLSEDGKRLYFTSSDVLSPRDTNGTQDVYQWEQGGAGGCDQGDPSFVPASGGCLSLISSGKSDYPSEFVDASPNGNDVFFSTLSSLVSQDYGLVDIYDARVGGGFPPPPPPKPPCEGEACQSSPAPPNDQTPSSAAFKGPGNPIAGKAPSCRKSKVRRKGRCVAKHHKRAHRAKRASRDGRAGR